MLSVLRFSPGGMAGLAPARPRSIVAARSRAQAVHPGYGFLSERAVFARAVRDAGLAFIGPRPATIDAMGDKVRARRLMREAGTPVIPGPAGPVGDPADALRQAEQVDVPARFQTRADLSAEVVRTFWPSAENTAQSTRPV